MLRSTMLSSSRSELRIDLSCSKLQKPYYTTLDEISGRVIYAPQSPTLVKDILIDFLGIAKTWVDPTIPGSPRRQANCQFLKMNDDKDFQNVKTASRTNPLELPFTFVVPRQLLPTVCKCPASVHKEEHLQLPPSMNSWKDLDDMSADMSKIEYYVRVKVIADVEGKSTMTAEVSEQVQILPVYTWWQQRQRELAGESSPQYERVESPLRDSSTPSLKVVETEKTLRKGFFGKKKGKVAVNMQVRDSYYSNLGQNPDSPSNSLSMPISMRYMPISADLPPNVSSLSARLHACTRYNVDPSNTQSLSGTYNTSITLLKALTPSTSSPLWLEDSSSSSLSFTTNLLIPMSLPSPVGTSTVKGQKILLPTFSSCYISRSYEIEVKVGFEGGNELALRVPITIIAKPGTSQAEKEFAESVRVADEWSPPGHETVAGNIEPELIRPTAENIRTPEMLNVEVLEAQEVTTETPGETEHVHVVPEGRPELVSQAPVVPQPELVTESPPDYEVVIAEMNKFGVHTRITALAA